MKHHFKQIVNATDKKEIRERSSALLTKINSMGFPDPKRYGIVCPLNKALSGDDIDEMREHAMRALERYDYEMD